MQKQVDTVLERFLSHVEVQENGCWLWTASKTRDGYGYFSPTHDHTVKAHRWSYGYFVGPIPDGLQLDHLCRNRSCVHPEHLEPVTIRENSRRGLNGTLKPHKTSQFVGVSWDKQTDKWKAYAHINGKRYSLGYFTLEEDAYQAYCTAVSVYEENGTLPTSPLVARKTSKYKGVNWDQIRKKWKVTFCFNKKTYHLGYFTSEEEAHQTYLNAATSKQKVA